MMDSEKSQVSWVDGPYTLLDIPSRVHDINSHSAIHCASEMAHAHNCLIRGLNSIVLQAPHIPDATDSKRFKAEDVQDLLTYTGAWVATVDHHHHTEETCMFPMIEECAKEPGLMSGPFDQHAEFHPGLMQLKTYSTTTKPQDFRWEGIGGMKEIIDAFAGSMVRHLHDEIDVFLSLRKMDSGDLKKCFDAGEKMAKAQGNLGMLYDVFPLVLGCCDKTHDGGNQFPPLPGLIPYVIYYWFGRRHSGAWRFNPCDYWGQPVPLQFLPANKASKA